ncbi:DUF7715 family protein [Geodermatophilus sp. CPCC 206100]|uniref:DUF7715 family protein n=1 Tax=Geodermatophilus sp. CPCC 206100 TaxID=3020054 RepID=UPI003B00B3BA
MKLLTATYTGQGERDGDFCFAIEGELVLVGDVCAADQADPDPDGGCGCGRAFTGMSSHRAGTTAMVRDLDLSLDDLQLAVEAHLVAAGTGPDVLGDEDFAELVEEVVQETAAFASWWPVGTVLGRRLDFVRRRTLPT